MRSTKSQYLELLSKTALLEVGTKYKKKRNNNKTVFFFVNRTHSYIYILFGYYPFTTGATTVGVTVVASLKLCTMQYKNIIDTLISTIIVNKSYCPLY